MRAFTYGDDVPVASEYQSSLQRLMSDWQIVTDLSFADLVLWYPDETGATEEDSDKPRQYFALGQARPFTAQTTLQQDLVGQAPEPKLAELIDAVMRTGVSSNSMPLSSRPWIPAVTAWPVKSRGTTWAVLTVHKNLVSQRRASTLEIVYQDSAQTLLQMISHGVWPEKDNLLIASDHGTPRVGDGLIRLSPQGLVEFASPNAVSAYRKLGVDEPLEGRQLARLTLDNIPPSRREDEDLPAVLFGRQSARVDITNRQVVLSARAIPLVGPNPEEPAGALVLLRDISEIRWRDHQLISKDATIREIHHRVKNNLQTVGSLLRIQSRRMTSEEARQELLKAMARVDTIAAVHETLSHTIDSTVDLDELMKRQFSMAIDLAAGGRAIDTEIQGDFGTLPGDFATPLALILNELVTNAVQHGSQDEDARIELNVNRLVHPRAEDQRLLRIEVFNSGADYSEQAAVSTGLGTSIVKTLVEADLGGTIDWMPASSGSLPRQGTIARIEIPLDEAGD